MDLRNIEFFIIFSKKKYSFGIEKKIIPFYLQIFFTQMFFSHFYNNVNKDSDGLQRKIFKLFKVKLL